ncbi:MAG: hypothetical protein EBR51_00225, partial [Gammaproteobacteria bacterium]|nr:hypothetical protein [Gammaproteobacteria bacterium]
MLFSLAEDAAPRAAARAAPAQAALTIFARFAMKGGREREVLVLPTTRFSKLKRGLCACEQLRAEDVCVFFEGRELQPGQRPCD